MAAKKKEVQKVSSTYRSEPKVIEKAKEKAKTLKTTLSSHLDQYLKDWVSDFHPLTILRAQTPGN